MAGWKRYHRKKFKCRCDACGAETEWFPEARQAKEAFEKVEHDKELHKQRKQRKLQEKASKRKNKDLQEEQGQEVERLTTEPTLIIDQALVLEAK